MLDLDQILLKVPSYHSKLPKFMATLDLTLNPIVGSTALLERLPYHFDLDNAVGAQLDVIGEWIGRSRTVTVPLLGIYFTWDDPLRGWDLANWKGPYDTPVGVTSLDDDTYRLLLRSNILAKHWDGTLAGAQTAFDVFFIDPATHVFLQDNAQVPFPRTFFSWDVVGQGWDESEWQIQNGITASVGVVDVSMTIGISGKIPNTATLALLGQGAIPIKPAGVAVNYAVTSVNNTPVFGFDVNNEFVGGWDIGSWGVTPEYILNQT